MKGFWGAPCSCACRPLVLSLALKGLCAFTAGFFASGPSAWLEAQKNKAEALSLLLTAAPAPGVQENLCDWSPSSLCFYTDSRGR